ncbi:hypothetical protein HMPREF2978_04790 [Corynebacterium sp. HMSC074C01]|uniref:hypothetical protein n=1 Tax=Corynebacterium sp. HMSC074C01 TaxID=1739482 RepID=UPI0008A3242D|nr:hypothetical protein [Corynebacterium sp. HMSC074C01]OFP66501.1 hypothetical protein HMPREF2978_04790 [Corynebacterium sp. HMSC074C01]
MTTYTTKNEAVLREIIEPLGEYANEHDVDTIADKLIIAGDNGFRLNQDADFWGVVANNPL